MTNDEKEDVICLYHEMISLYARLGFVSHEVIDAIIERVRTGSGCDYLEAKNIIAFLRFIQTHDSVET